MPKEVFLAHFFRSHAHHVQCSANSRNKINNLQGVVITATNSIDSLEDSILSIKTMM